MDTTGTEEMYLKLGTLLTTIIEADATILRREKDRLKILIQNHLTIKEEFMDPRGKLRLYDMSLIFPQEAPGNSNTAIEACIDFLIRNKEAFNATMKKISLHVAQELSLVYLGTAKAEKELFNQLKRELKKIRIKEYA